MAVENFALSFLGLGIDDVLVEVDRILNGEVSDIMSLQQTKWGRVY